jgi:hypothetical protein
MPLCQSEHEIYFYENRNLSEIVDGEIIFNAEGMETILKSVISTQSCFAVVFIFGVAVRQMQ